MAKVRALKTFRVSELGRSVSPGDDEFELSEATAGSLERKGMVLRMPGAGAGAKGGGKKPPANKAARRGPLPATGGRTGAAKPASSSRAGRARGKRGSKA